MTDLEDELRSQLASLPDLPVPEDLLTNLRRRQARRRILAPATLVSIVVLILIAVPLGLRAAHRSGGHSGNPVSPVGSAAMTVTLHPLSGSVLEPGARAATLEVLQARMRAMHITGTVRAGNSADTLRITGLTGPLPSSLLSVGALTLHQVYAVTAGDANPVDNLGSTPRPQAPSQCANLSKTGAGDVPSPNAVCLYETVQCSTYQVMAIDQPADNWSVSCSRDKSVKYLLRAAAVNGKNVQVASAIIPATTVGTGEWLVDLAFTPAGQQRFTDLTRAAIVAQAPQNQVAIVVDGVVESAPAIMAAIPGDASITGNYDRTQAEQLAAVLSSGPLPARLTW